MKNLIEINSKIKTFDENIEVTGDKSLSIRCVLMASQAIGKSKIYNLLESEDVLNSLKAISKLGIQYRKYKNYYEIYGFGIKGFHYKKNIKINAGNSGTLARLILGLLIDAKKELTLIGDKSLAKRDFSRVTEPLRLFGAEIKSNNGKLPVKILGSKFLRPINYFENIGSAQCKSSVMLASLKAPGITKIKAKKSRNHTELLFKTLGLPIKIIQKKNYDYFYLNGENNFKSFNYRIPGDISSCSFFLVLTILSDNSKLTIKNVNINKSRTGIVSILNKMNAKIKFKNIKSYKNEPVADILVESRKNLKAINCPKNLNSAAIDEFLVIFLVAAKAKGISIFRDLGELNQKESPRLDIAIKFLKMIGVKVSRKNNNIKIYGNPNLDLKGNYVMKHFRKDHRVFMMSCVAALTFGGTWKIHDKDSINTSFPEFFKIIKVLGAKKF